jgi:hypothetical protein
MIKIALSVLLVSIITRKLLRNAVDVAETRDRDEPVFQLRKVKKKMMTTKKRKKKD